MQPHRPIHLSPMHICLLIGSTVCLTSQLYFSILAEGFRLSASAVVFPLLLLTLRRESHRPDAGMVTALCVILFRVTGDLIGGSGLLYAFLTELPGGVFYLCYDTVLCVMLRDRRISSFRYIWLCLFCCDLLSNTLNAWLSSHFGLNTVRSAFILLCWTALLRSTCALALLRIGYGYRQLLLREEHEVRYRRLFLMTASLKSELYFLKKDAEDVESVMAHAYQLYEQLEQQPVPEELRALALSIARDVHEIKKDNLRIIRGLESEVSEVYDHESMRMRDLLNILTQSTRQLLGAQRSDIRLSCFCPADIPIQEHYRVLSVLKNLVTNAIEAIQATTGAGTVQVDALAEGESLVLIVADNGPGISARAKKLLFRVGYSTKFDPDTGSINRGVGLPAVQFIVDELGGTLAVESEPGQGTTFRVTFPISAVSGGSA